MERYEANIYRAHMGFLGSLACGSRYMVGYLGSGESEVVMKVALHFAGIPHKIQVFSNAGGYMNYLRKYPLSNDELEQIVVKLNQRDQDKFHIIPEKCRF